MRIDPLLKILMRNPRKFKSVVIFAGLLYLTKISHKREPIKLLREYKIHPKNYLPVLKEVITDLESLPLEEYSESYAKLKYYCERLNKFLDKGIIG